MRFVRRSVVGLVIAVGAFGLASAPVPAADPPALPPVPAGTEGEVNTAPLPGGLAQSDPFSAGPMTGPVEEPPAVDPVAVEEIVSLDQPGMAKTIGRSMVRVKLPDRACQVGCVRRVVVG